jgi:hypothetical protein
MGILKEINKDPTLRYFYESKIDYKHFDHQLELKIFAIKQGLHRWLEKT